VRAARPDLKAAAVKVTTVTATTTECTHWDLMRVALAMRSWPSAT
jgi:hypothetical protein